MKRSDAVHPPLRWIADRIDGTLSATRTARLAEHLAAGCTACAEREAALRSALAAMRRGPLAAPPRRLVRSASRLFAEARLAAAADRVRRVIARLVGDAPSAAPAFAMRAAPGAERRLLWRIDGYDIDACIVAGERSASVLGQIVPDDDRAHAGLAGEVTAVSGGRSVRAAVGADGRFEFRRLSAGLWSVEGRAGDVAFATPPFGVERAG